MRGMLLFPQSRVAVNETGRARLELRGIVEPWSFIPVRIHRATLVAMLKNAERDSSYVGAMPQKTQPPVRARERRAATATDLWLE